MAGGEGAMAVRAVATWLVEPGEAVAVVLAEVVSVVVVVVSVVVVSGVMVAAVPAVAGTVDGGRQCQ